MIEIKSKEEIDLMEDMINNLLLSDRLSLPYSKLDFKKYTTREIVNKVLEMFPSNIKKIKINL